MTPDVLRKHWQEQGLTWPEDARFARDVQNVLAFSPFVACELERQAETFARQMDVLLNENFQPDYMQAFQHWQPDQPMEVRLRRFRRFHTAVLAWRDLTQRDTVEQTLLRLSELAQCCIEQALRHCEAQLEPGFGLPLDAQGKPQRMTVLGMGKLGGCELNFSSDIDLIFCYREQGTTAGPRKLENEQWFVRLGQQLIRLLDEVSDEGFVYRVDMRLRPYGKAGRLALSHAAMETYYETQGRMWERYALIKARPVAGDIEAGHALLQNLQPFIYRRYMDYTAFDELADMKRSIHAQYQDRRLNDNIKLGPGGIREVEFIVQSFQLIWGGRIAALRHPPLQPALAALQAQQLFDAPSAAQLLRAYLYLRRLENHLQARNDTQTQTLPEDEQQRLQLAHSMGHAQLEDFHQTLEQHRCFVQTQFAGIFDDDRQAPDHWQQYAERLRAALNQGEPCEPVLAGCGITPADEPCSLLQRWWASPAFRQISPRGRQRLNALLPDLLQAASEAEQPADALVALLELVQAIARRSAYLALLQSHRPALNWLQQQLLASRWVRTQLLEHPLLLDEMLEWKTHATLDPPERWRADLQRMLAALPAEDEEQALVLLRQFALSRKLQIALLELQGALSAAEAARQLTRLAEVVLLEALQLAREQIRQRHGSLPGEGPLHLLAYGSLAADNLSYESDLDLVFLYQGRNEQAMSDGPRPLPAAVYQARLAQRFMHLLTTRTTAGQLYEIDLRLRPNGNAGLLVSTFEAFARYQREKSWTWEHQALVKARVLGEADALQSEFEALRKEVLTRPRDVQALQREVCDMRQRMWREKPVPAGGFHLKNSPGGLVDLDFLLQYTVLAHARTCEQMLETRSLVGLLQTLSFCGLLKESEVQNLQQALEVLLSAVHRAHLNQRPVLLEQQPAETETVSLLWQQWLSCGQAQQENNKTAS